MLKLCPFSLEIKSQVSCAHCRFRKTFFALKSLGRIKDETQVSRILHRNSESIVNYCVEKMKLTTPETSLCQIKTNRQETTQKPSIELAVLSHEVKREQQILKAPSFEINPIAELHGTFYSMSQKSEIIPFFHNRNYPGNQLKLHGNCLSGITDANGISLTQNQLSSINTEYINYKRIDKKIFQDLFSTVFKQTILDFSTLNHAILLGSLEQFVIDCVENFYRLLEMLKFSASQNDKGELLASPYGMFAVSKASIFQNITLFNGLNDATAGWSMGMHILDIMKKFDEYQLILSYLMVLAHTIDKSVMTKYPPDYLIVVQLFQNKIVCLCKNMGLYEQCQIILDMAKWWKERNYEKGHDVLRIFEKSE